MDVPLKCLHEQPENAAGKKKSKPEIYSQGFLFLKNYLFFGAFVFESVQQQVTVLEHELTDCWGRIGAETNLVAV